MKTCCVLFCTQKGVSKNVSYHRVPNVNNPLREVWLKKIRRRDYIYKPVINIFVCSKHFQENDYLKSYASNYKLLKQDVVPSKFSWDFETFTPSTTTSCTSTKNAPSNLGDASLNSEVQHSEIEGVLTVSDKTDEYIVAQRIFTSNTSTSCTATNNALSTLGNDSVNSEVQHPSEMEGVLTVSDNSDEYIVAQSIFEVRVPFEMEGILTSSSNSDESVEKQKYRPTAEIEQMRQEIEALKIKLLLANKKFEIQALQLKDKEKQLADEKIKVKQLTHSLKNIKDDEKSKAFYTALPSFKTAMAVYEFLKPEENGEIIIP